MKTILIGTLIAAGTGLLFCANAVFESTDRGLEASFIGSLTGDFAVGAQADETYGLFGSEVPIVSEYEGIPPIADFSSVSQALNDTEAVRSWTPIVSAAAQINIGGYVVKAPIFGVDPVSYFRVCSDILIQQGDPTALQKGGVFLNESLAKAAEKILGRPLNLGEPIVFSMYAKGSFNLRRGIFAGVHRYPAPTEALDRVVLADPVLVRALCGYTLGNALKSASEPIKTQDADNLDDLFSSSSDIVADKKDGLTLSQIESNLADTSRRDAIVMTDTAAWSFVLSRVGATATADDARREVSHRLSQSKTEARVISWRTAAGSSALMLFAVRTAFNVGVGFLILGAVLVVMNALVISVLERTGEIGSMRALGASRSFIRGLFITETMTLTVISAFIGVCVGSVVCLMLSRNGIPLTNPLLRTLFGGSVVRPLIGARLMAVHLLGAVAIGSFAWIYPVSLALKIQPVTAMSERA